MTKLHKPSIQVMADQWQSPFVAHQEAEKFPGGIVNPKYISNLDAQSKGPKGHFRLGRKIAYLVSIFIIWLEEKSNIGRRGAIA